MSVLVEQQDEQITVIETTAGEVEKDMEMGVSYTDKAVESAKGARKKRKICFILSIVLLIIIGIVVAVVVVKNLPAKQSGGSSGTKTVTASATSTAGAVATAAARLGRLRAALPAPTPLVD